MRLSHACTLRLCIVHLTMGEILALEKRSRPKRFSVHQIPLESDDFCT